MRVKLIKKIFTVMLAMNIAIISLCVLNAKSVSAAEPRFNNISAASLTIGFDKNNVVYCGFVLTPYSNCGGGSGIMRLYDSTGSQVKSWAISDFESPYAVEKTYQGTYGETYTLTFQGYAYSNNGGMYDDIELSVTGHCIDG